MQSDNILIPLIKTEVLIPILPSFILIAETEKEGFEPSRRVNDLHP